MATTQSNGYRTLALIAGIGSALTFIGHGALAAQRNTHLVELIGASLRFLPSGTPEVMVVGNMTHAIGVVDIIVGAILGVLAIIMWADTGRLRRWMLGLLVGLYAWAIFWQGVTAASEWVAGSANPGLWFLLEYAPLYLLPVVGMLATLRLRRSFNRKDIKQL